MKESDRKLAAEIGLAFGSEDTVSKDEKASKPWQFKPGNKANPAGRPKGSRNKLGEKFIDALQRDFEANGLDAIKKMRKLKPHEYVKVLASILPKQVDVTIDPIEQLTEEDLARQLSGLLEAISGRIAETGLTDRTSLAEKELEKQARTLSSLH